MGGRGSKSNQADIREGAVRPGGPTDSTLAPYGRFDVAMPTLPRYVRLAVSGGPDPETSERDRERGREEVRYNLARMPVGSQVSFAMGASRGERTWTKEADNRWSAGTALTFGDRDVADELTGGSADASSIRVREPRQRPRENRAASPYERTRARVYATGNRWAIENFNATH